MKLLISLVLLAAALTAQTGPTLPLSAPTPPGVTSGLAATVGGAGTATYYYWLVAKYPGGNAAPYGPITAANAPASPSGGNFIRVTWGAVAGASSYDLLRTTTTTRPGPTCTCLLAASETGTSYSDTGGSLTAYTVTTAGAATADIWLDNLSATPPILQQTIDGVTKPIGSGGGGGADIGLAVSRTNSTVLAIAAGSARTGNTTTTFAAATATLSGTSANGTAFVYVTGNTLFVGHNTAATVTCSGCTTVTGITAFPAGAIPLATATFTASAWDTNGVADQRAALSTKALAAGANITISDSGGVATISATGGGAAACGSGTVFPLTFEPFESFQSGNQETFSSLAVVRVYAFSLPCTGTPVNLGWWVAAESGTCGGTCGLGFSIYDASGAKIFGNTVAVSGGTPNINTQGYKSIAFVSPVSLTAGARYFLATSTTSTTYRFKGGESWEACNGRNIVGTSCATAANAFTGSGASVAGPATLGALTKTSGADAASVVPYFWVSF